MTRIKAREEETGGKTFPTCLSDGRRKGYQHQKQFAAELADITLKSNGRKPAELVYATHRRKEVYERLFPETVHGASGNGREKSRNYCDSTEEPERFTLSTAKPLISFDAKLRSMLVANLARSIHVDDKLTPTSYPRRPQRFLPHLPQRRFQIRTYGPRQAARHLHGHAQQLSFHHWRQRRRSGRRAYARDRQHMPVTAPDQRAARQHQFADGCREGRDYPTGCRV
ncbi:hypothetical protein [Shinella sp.]|uniref:hypothetical protein n=1 Tax=Shinella sp. TaxID=1870904 RepID=UPI0025867B31|nr:hypothetical protein [Shinella sp.]MCW5706113.1 hypothetical protein [Shinella sp.]